MKGGIFIIALALLSATATYARAEAKSNLEITFLTSLSGDSVKLFVSEKKVYEGRLATLPTGTSGSTTIPSSGAQTHLKVFVPELGLGKSMDVDTGSGAFLYITIDKDRISLVQEKQPRYYQ